MSHASRAPDLVRGARNLLENCAGALAGDRLLILEEDPALGHYEAGLADAIAAQAETLGLRVRRMEVPFSAVAASPSDAVLSAMAAADHILYLARLGDQTRFRPLPGADRSIVSYVLDRAQLASAFGTTTHQAMVALKVLVNDAMAEAAEIRVTCPLGTEFRGSITRMGDGLADVGIKRFPMSVFAPLPMAGFSGQVALARFLVGTGSVYYDPFMLPLASVCQVRFEGNRVLAYDGPEGECARIRAHVDHVAAELGLEGAFVHSWHAGLHPGCAYAGRAEDNPGHWGSSAFGNPRLMHVHTCGTYAPGEICWNVLDPTITLDGVALWEEGRLHPDRIAGGAALLARWPELAAVFANPATEVGIA